MQLSGLLHGAKLLRFVNFPVPDVQASSCCSTSSQAPCRATPASPATGSNLQP